MEMLLVINSILLWVLVLFNLLLTLALVRKLNAGSAQVPQGLKSGAKAPDFSAQTLDGKAVGLANYIGKQVAFLFVSPHCGPCKEKMPEYQALYPKAQRAGAELVLVSIEGTVEEARAMAADFKLAMPMLLAPQDSNPFMKDYQVGGTPSYCVVDEQGKVQSAGYPNVDVDGNWKKLVEAWEGRVESVKQMTLAEG